MSKRVVLTEYRLTLPKLKEPFTVAQVSDLHERRSDQVIELLARVKPDLIVLTGDTLERFCDDVMRPDRMMNLGAAHRLFLRAACNVNYYFMMVFGRKDLPKTENAYELLTRSAAIAPVYMSLGNHEQLLRDEDLELLQRHGITLLDNADVSARVKGNELIIGGLSTVADEQWLARFAAKDGFKLLLCHHPEYYDGMVAGREIDLTLAGHNHGGQIRIFGRGLMSSGEGILPKYDKGVYNNRLVVSAGCSNTVALPRWGNPREVVAVHLEPQA